MKKAISLLLILTLTLSLSIVGFAASDSGVYLFPDTYNAPLADISNINATRITLDPLATPGSTQTYSIGANELVLVEGNRIVGTETELRPDETYKFDIYYNPGGAISSQSAAQLLAGGIRKLAKTDLGDKGSVKVRTIKGSSAIKSAKVRASSTSGTITNYRLEIETRPNYSTRTTDVEYSLNVVDSNASATFAESFHTFVVGFRTISDSETDVGEGGIITISNENPVILKEQFVDIANSANHKNVIFESEDGNWIFTGRVSGMKDTNFSFNYDPDVDLLNKFPDMEFKFLNFPAGVNFPTTGEMRIDVSDISSDFGTMYAYLYRDGRLTEINTTYDSGADELIFRTNYLGNFIITNARITDTSLIPEPEEEEEDEEIIVPEEGPTHNPGTGASDAANIMAALGLVSLASAAAVSRKRK